MTITFTVDEVVDALYGGVLGRKPDTAGRAAAVQALHDDPAYLKQLIVNLVSSPERFNAERFQPMILRALYRAALGREPDPRAPQPIRGSSSKISPKASRVSPTRCISARSIRIA